MTRGRVAVTFRGSASDLSAAAGRGTRDENEYAMKLNFWQWLGVVLVVVGLIWFLYTNRAKTTTTPPADLPAATSPTP